MYRTNPSKDSYPHVASVLVLSVYVLIQAVRCFPVMEEDTEVIPKDEPLHRLLQVFGMDHPGRREHHHRPPQYMLDLYNAIADSSGITRTPQPYRANIVRSFPDKDVGHQQRFFFQLTGASVPSRERLLQAELHLFKGRSRDKTHTAHLLQVRIYQVMNPNTTYTEQGNRLLDSRRISTHSTGWEVFYVKDAAIDWLEDPNKNYGLLVTVRNMQGSPADFGLLKFAKRHQHHSDKQPILVIFTDDGRQKRVPSGDNKGFENYGYPNLQRDKARSADEATPELSMNLSLHLNSSHLLITEPDDFEISNKTLSRIGRAVNEPKDLPSTSGCTRHELHVDFEKIGWSSWIISPKWYNAYFCKGECAFPLGQNQWPTNHATVQSIVHELNLSPGLGTPCCVPSKLYSINLLYFDEHGNVILKQYDDMVAASCGCH